MNKRAIFRVLVVSILFSFPFIQAYADASKKLDFTAFLGEKITLSKQPANIKTIEFSLSFPEDYKFLDEGISTLKIYSLDGKELKNFIIHNNINIFPFKKKFSGELIYFELVLNYCREGNVPMCLMKNVLFTVPLDKSLKEKSINLEYNVKSVEY